MLLILIEKHSEQVASFLWKEVDALKAHNKKLPKLLAFNESLNVTLASKDIYLAKSQVNVDELKAVNNKLRLYAKTPKKQIQERQN